MAHRIERVNNLIRREVSELIQREVRDPRLDAFIAVTEVATFAEAGVARISLGSSLARVIHRAIVDAARSILDGDFTPLADGISSGEIDRLLAQGSADAG